jgi:hypothetical protein
VTCIVGVIQGPVLYMGGDSAVTGGYDVTIRPGVKVFINKNFLIGCCGSARACNLVRYKFVPPDPSPDEDDMMRYFVVQFVESLRECLTTAGNITKKDEFDYMHSQFLVGYWGRMFLIDSDFQTQECVNGYESIGAGSDLALGSLFATPKMTPKRRIMTALGAAQQYNSSVREPFSVVKVKW